MTLRTLRSEKVEKFAYFTEGKIIFITLGLLLIVKMNMNKFVRLGKLKRMTPLIRRYDKVENSDDAS